MKKVFALEDLDCANCAAKMENAVSKIDGVHAVNVSFIMQRMTLEADDERFEAAQFQLGDHRSLAEVIEDLGRNGYIPSFCTGCYRLGRTGKDFMDLAKPGLIKRKCAPNALSTFEEYLLDYATPKARAAGEDAIARQLASMDDKVRQISERLLARVRSGSRDVYC